MKQKQNTPKNHYSFIRSQQSYFLIVTTEYKGKTPYIFLNDSNELRVS